MSHQDGISLRRFAAQIGVSENCLRRWCIAGKVLGARKHPLTKKWTIYPPAKLVTGSGDWRVPALKGGAA